MTTISSIISETCDALWSILFKHILLYILQKWLSIFNEFEEI